MSTLEDVELFLKNFHFKLGFYDVLFIDSRKKNLQALAELNLVPNDRKKVILELTIENYCKGPEKDHSFHDREVWFFGKMIRSKLVYIKISMGAENSPVICISFHVSERSLSFPFKK